MNVRVLADNLDRGAASEAARTLDAPAVVKADALTGW